MSVVPGRQWMSEWGVRLAVWQWGRTSLRDALLCKLLGCLGLVGLDLGNSFDSLFLFDDFLFRVFHFDFAVQLCVDALGSAGGSSSRATCLAEALELGLCQLLLDDIGLHLRV